MLHLQQTDQTLFLRHLLQLLVVAEDHLILMIPVHIMDNLAGPVAALALRLGLAAQVVLPLRQRRAMLAVRHRVVLQPQTMNLARAVAVLALSAQALQQQDLLALAATVYHHL